ncbi:MAG: hypothetical protein HJJLKODD_01414 [Phycisphaerae bacterium]|nr:hypothetical protein [Phycisphaerae bacterium]
MSIAPLNSVTTAGVADRLAADYSAAARRRESAAEVERRDQNTDIPNYRAIYHRIEIAKHKAARLAESDPSYNRILNHLNHQQRRIFHAAKNDDQPQAPVDNSTDPQAARPVQATSAESIEVAEETAGGSLDLVG